MKKFLLLFVALIPTVAFSQATAGFHRVTQAIQRTPQGGVTAQVVPNATIVLTDTATGGTPLVYLDPGLSVLISPPILTADLNGNYDYYIPLNSCITETISSPGSGLVVIPNICSNGGDGLPALSGTGSPSVSCSSANINQFYTDTASQTLYQCNGTIWVLFPNGGASLPNNSLVFGLTPSTSRAATTTDIATLLSSLTGCGSLGLVYSPASSSCISVGSSGVTPSPQFQFSYFPTTGTVGQVAGTSNVFYSPSLGSTTFGTSSQPGTVNIVDANGVAAPFIALNGNVVPTAEATLTQPFYNVAAYGAKGDGTRITCNFIAGNPTYSCPSANFTGGDNGKIMAAIGTGLTGTGLSGTVMHSTNCTNPSAGVYAITATNTLRGTEPVYAQGYSGACAVLNGQPLAVVNSNAVTTANPTSTAFDIVFGSASGGAADTSAGTFTIIGDQVGAVAVIDSTHISGTATSGHSASMTPDITRSATVIYGTDNTPLVQAGQNALQTYALSKTTSVGHNSPTLYFPQGDYLFGGDATTGLVTLLAGQIKGEKGAGTVRLIYAGPNNGVFLNWPSNAFGNNSFQGVTLNAISNNFVPSVHLNFNQDFDAMTNIEDVDIEKFSQIGMALNGNIAANIHLGPKFVIRQGCGDFLYVKNGSGQRSSNNWEPFTIDFGSAMAAIQGCKVSHAGEYDDSVAKQPGGVVNFAIARIEDEPGTRFAANEAPITAWSVTTTSGLSVATLTAANSYTAGDAILLRNFGTSTFFNTLYPLQVLSSGLSGTQFSVNLPYAVATSSATEMGLATTIPHLFEFTTDGSADGSASVPPIDLSIIAVNLLGGQYVAAIGTNDKTGRNCPTPHLHHLMADNSPGNTPLAFGYMSGNGLWCGPLSGGGGQIISQPSEPANVASLVGPNQEVLTDWEPNPGGDPASDHWIGDIADNLVQDSNLRNTPTSAGSAYWTIPSGVGWAVCATCGFTGGAGFSNAQTGSVATGSLVPSAPIPVLAGRTYYFAADVDCSQITVGTAGFAIQGTGFTTQTFKCPGAGLPAGKVAGYFKIPQAGVTAITVAADTANTIGVVGTFTYFSRPQLNLMPLSPITPRFPYQEGQVPGSAAVANANALQGIPISTTPPTVNYVLQYVGGAWTPEPLASGGITALTGDATASGTGSVPLTLATVNSNVGSCGDATHVCQTTYNAKGLATAATPVAITGSSPITQNAGGDLACAVAADTSINSTVVTAGSSTSSTMIFTMASVPPSMKFPGAVIGATGNTPSGYNGAAFTVTGATATAVTVSSTNNPGTMTGFGTIFLACSNQSNDAIAATPVTMANGYTAAANYFSNGIPLNIDFHQSWWTSSAPPAATLTLRKGSTGLYASGALPMHASNVASASESDFHLSGISTTLVNIGPLIGQVPTSALPQSFVSTFTQPITISASSELLGFQIFWNATGVASGTYTSGITATGTTGQTCALTAFNDSSTATATVALTGTNTIAGGTALVITSRGQSASAAPTTATSGNGTATCTGTATIATVLGGSPGNAVLGTAAVARTY